MHAPRVGADPSWEEAGRERYRVGDFVWDPASGELTSERGTERLQPQPALLLQTLVENAGRVVSRDDLYEALWPDTKVEFDLGLNAAVRNLRSALGDSAAEPRYVETLRRRGYRLIAEVEVLAAPPPAVESTASARARAKSPHRVGVAALAVLAIASIVATGETQRDATPPEPELARIEYLIDTGDRPALLRAFRILDSLPRSIARTSEARLLRAHALYHSGDYEAARGVADSVLLERPGHPEALRVVGLSKLFGRLDPEGAVTDLERARAVAPTSENLHAFALASAANGDLNAAMRAMREAVRLDPVQPLLQVDGWLIAYMAREFTTSGEYCDAHERLVGEPGHRCHLLTALGAGDRRGAASRARLVLVSHGVPADDTTEAEAVLERFWRWELDHVRARPDSPGKRFAEARALAQLGRRDAALESLASARRMRASVMVFADGLAYFDSLRGDPRFDALVGRTE